MRLFFWTRSLLGLLFPWYGALGVQQMAGEVARQCQGNLWRCVAPRTRGMSIAEIRGYTRAFAGSGVMGEVERMIRRRGLNSAVGRQVADAAIDQLVIMVLRDVLCEPPPATRTLAA